MEGYYRIRLRLVTGLLFKLEDPDTAARNLHNFNRRNVGPDTVFPDLFVKIQLPNQAWTATLSPVMKREASMWSASLSSSVVFPSMVAGKGSPGVKEGKVTSDSATLMRQEFVTVRSPSCRRIKSFRISRDCSSTCNCKENSGLYWLKLFSALESGELSKLA